jgi:hypothetical protein
VAHQVPLEQMELQVLQAPLVRMVLAELQELVEQAEQEVLQV